MYDAEIAYTDEMIGRLFDYVQSLNLEDTVFVVTSDHGELFGEQNMLAHKLVLDDAVLRVPLVVHGLDLEGVKDNLVQHSDVMKTIMSDSGIETDKIQGFNIRDEKRDFTVSQRGAADFTFVTKHDPDFDTSRYHTSPLTVMRTHQFKYLKSETRRNCLSYPTKKTMYLTSIRT